MVKKRATSCVAMSDARVMPVEIPAIIIIKNFVDWGDRGRADLKIEVSGVPSQNQQLILQEALKRLSLKFVKETV